MNGFILKGHICYSTSPEEIAVCPDAYAVCVDGRSKGVFSQIPQEYSELPLIDHGDKLIIPGMTDLHIHAPQFSYRGTSMDLELMQWLEQYTFPEEAKFKDLEYAKKAYGIFADALRRSATTRACIFATRHREATLLLMEEMERTGLVTYVGKVNMDRATEELQEESAKHSAEETKAWIEQSRERFQYTRPILTPRFIPSCTDELMEELHQIQMAYDLPVQSHLSENPNEIEFVHTLRPQDAFYGEGYAAYELFGKNETLHKEVPTIMAHCVWSVPEEVELMRKNGVFVAHCPASNMNLSSGIAPIRKYLELGMRVGLGSDIAGGHSESIFQAIADTVQVSKLYWRLVDQTCKPILFAEAFYMATKGGGAFFGSAGSFEEGYAFDAVVLDDSALVHPQELTVLERLERAVYLLLDTKGIAAKYVQGRKIF